MDNNQLVEVLRKIVKEETAPINTRLGVLEKNIEGVEKNIKMIEKNMATKTDVQALAVDMAELFHETWKRMDRTDARVTIIEDHLDLPHPTKN